MLCVCWTSTFSFGNIPADCLNNITFVKVFTYSCELLLKPYFPSVWVLCLSLPVMQPSATFGWMLCQPILSTTSGTTPKSKALINRHAAATAAAAALNQDPLMFTTLPSLVCGWLYLLSTLSRSYNLYVYLIEKKIGRPLSSFDVFLKKVHLVIEIIFFFF